MSFNSVEDFLLNCLSNVPEEGAFVSWGNDGQIFQVISSRWERVRIAWVSGGRVQKLQHEVDACFLHPLENQGISWRSSDSTQ